MLNTTGPFLHRLGSWEEHFVTWLICEQSNSVTFPREDEPIATRETPALRLVPNHLLCKVSMRYCHSTLHSPERCYQACRESFSQRVLQWASSKSGTGAPAMQRWEQLIAPLCPTLLRAVGLSLREMTEVLLLGPFNSSVLLPQCVPNVLVSIAVPWVAKCSQCCRDYPGSIYSWAGNFTSPLHCRRSH